MDLFKHYRRLCFPMVYIWLIGIYPGCDHSSTQKEIRSQTSENRFTFDDFPQKVRLIGTDLNFGSNMGDGTDFFLIEDSLIIYSSLVDGFHGHLFDINQSHIIHFGKDGRGPGELLTAYSFDFRTEDRTLWILDIKRNNWTGYSLDELIHGETEQAYISEIRFDISAVQYPFWLNSDTIVGISITDPSARLFYFDREGNSIFKSGSIPEKADDNIVDHVHGQIYQGMLIPDPDRKYMAFSNRYSDMIQVYLASGEKAKELLGPEPIDPVFELLELDGLQNFSINQYTTEASTQVTANHMGFFLLFSGKSNSDGQQSENYSPYWRSMSNQVLMIDWSGTPRILYQLDRPVINILISSDGKYLYALDYLKPELVKYPLSRI